MDQEERTQRRQSRTVVMAALIGAAGTILAAIAGHRQGQEQGVERQMALQKKLEASSAEVAELRRDLATQAKSISALQDRLKQAQVDPSITKPAPDSPSPQSQFQSGIEGFAFTLERCVRESADLKCWLGVTNNREGRELKVFVDGSWLRDQDNNTHNVARALGTGGESEFNILGVDLPNKSTARFGLLFKGLAGVVTSVRSLKVHALGFDVVFQGELGVK